MKTPRHFLALLLLTGLVGSQTGCKKKEDVDPSKGLSTKIQNILPQAALNDLKTKGLVVNEGSQPPNVVGIYIANPFRLLSPYSPDDSYAKGRVIGDYKYRFYDQTNDDIKVDYKNNGGDTGSGQGAFLSGFRQKFTLYLAGTGSTSSTVTYKFVKVYSGEMTSAGIANFQEALTITEKNDPNSTLIPVNQARVWEDGDQLASKTSTYRIGVNEDPLPAIRASSAVSKQ